MSFETALRLTELLLGFAILQQSLEHLRSPWGLRNLYLLRSGLGIALMLGFWPGLVAMALLGIGIFLLHWFGGPYNGGSDRMSLLILICLCLAHLLPELNWQMMAFSYLAIQLVLSYLISGWVKIINREWRSGLALCNVFMFSAYPVSGQLRNFANWPKLLFVMSWCVILFELAFPFALAAPLLLSFGLAIAATFHLANACLFGLNRFVWAWISAYPSIIWFQHYLTTASMT